MPCFRATRATEAPASSVSSTTLRRSPALRRRRTPAPDPTLTSTSAIQTSSRHKTTMYTRPRQDAYDSRWRNRAEFAIGREQIVAFLARKWTRELDYRLIKELWAFYGNRIAVRFAYEYHDDSGNWFRAYGNENWEFDNQGLMYARHASINELPIRESNRKFNWPLGRRPDEHPGLSDLGL